MAVNGVPSSGCNLISFSATFLPVSLNNKTTTPSSATYLLTITLGRHIFRVALAGKAPAAGEFYGLKITWTHDKIVIDNDDNDKLVTCKTDLFLHISIHVVN